MADSHPAQLNTDARATARSVPAARGPGWRRIFFDPDPEANARYARVDAELAVTELRLPRRGRAWSVLAGIVLSWLLVVLLAWLALRPGAPPPAPHGKDPSSTAASHPHG